MIDNFEVTGGYNFAADSMNWSYFNVNLRLKFPKLNNYSLNLNTQLDPYMYELNALGSPIRTNKQYWHHGRMPHWNGLRWSFSYTISDQTIKKWKEKIEARREGRVAKESPPEDTSSQPTDTTDPMQPLVKNEDGTDRNAKLGSKKDAVVDDGYIKTEIPWSLSINYSLSYGNGSEFDYDKMYYKMVFSHYLTLNGNIGLGKGWKVSANMTYNFDYKKVTACTFNISRDLHCWNMTASINPIGPFKSYTFHIGVNHEGYTLNQLRDFVRESLEKLLPFAEKYGIVMGIENGIRPERPIAAFGCISWVFNPAWREYLPDTD